MWLMHEEDPCASLMFVVGGGFVRTGAFPKKLFVGGEKLIKAPLGVAR